MTAVIREPLSCRVPNPAFGQRQTGLGPSQCLIGWAVCTTRTEHVPRSTGLCCPLLNVHDFKAMIVRWLGAKSPCRQQFIGKKWLFRAYLRSLPPLDWSGCWRLTSCRVGALATRATDGQEAANLVESGSCLKPNETAIHRAEKRGGKSVPYSPRVTSGRHGKKQKALVRKADAGASGLETFGIRCAVTCAH